MPKKEAIYKIENMTENQVGVWMKSKKESLLQPWY